MQVKLKFIYRIIILFLLTGCNPYLVKARLDFDGTKIDNVTPVQPKFWFRSEDKNVAVTPTVQYKDGCVKIYDLPPGNYGMSVNIDANPANPPSYPGDFRSWSQFNVSQGHKSDLEIELQKIIHLTAPQDNATVMRYWDAECNEKISFNSPTVFSWESLGAGVYYDYRIEKMSCKPYKTLDSPIGATTQETSISVSLPTSALGEFYQFTLIARKNGRTIGMLMTHGGNGYGWDFRFRIN
jgi:hypothetical protein